MKKSKILSSALALALAVGPLAYSAKANSVEQTNDVGKPTYHVGGAFDLGIANDERLIEMLKREGKLAQNASPAEAEKVLKGYLKSRSENAKKEKEKFKEIESSLRNNSSNIGLINGNGNKLGQGKDIASVEEADWNGEQRSDNLLILMIEYPNFPASNIEQEFTDMYYDEYTPEHYNQMLFGDSYKGPNGEDLISLKRYYEEQSGGSYTVTGQVSTYWYEAKEDAAYYGGNNEGGNDKAAGELVKEALAQAATDPNINFAEFDQNGDKFIDQLMVVHSSVGEEAGGGQLGANAIWSHKSSIYDLIDGQAYYHNIPGTNYYAYNYTIQPADGAAGVFTHEFGHALGLPDEYDTVYSGEGEPVSYWSLMSSGSWAGSIPGTEPPGFSAWAKEQLQASMPGSNWLTGSTFELEEIDANGVEVLIDEAVTKGTNNDAVRVNLPDKRNIVNLPTSGEYEYYSGKGNSLDNSMTTTLDLTDVTNAELTFNAWYEIEKDWDYASIKVNGESIKGNITTSEDPMGYDQNPGHGITGSSNGWVEASFDLSSYAGQEEVELEFNYWSDGYVALQGFYVDDIVVTADGETILSDNAEGESSFELSGFNKDTGSFFSTHYYLLEWRTHNGVDEGLSHIRRGASLMSFDPGLVVWYYDGSYDNNWTGVHPGDGFLGVVDADQHTLYWDDKAVGSTRYQVHDAAFNINKSSKMFLDYPGLFTMKDNYTKSNPLFDDSADWSNPGLVDAGRNVPEFGLKIRVVGQSEDGTVGKILIFK